MNFKILVFLSLAAVATIANDDSFLMERYLQTTNMNAAMNYNTASIVTCTADAGCTFGCCAQWVKLTSATQTPISAGTKMFMACTPFAVAFQNRTW